jgi:muramoyltetrapeptide carboxypeptidase
MDIPIIHPAALKPGDTIGIIAPAGPVENREAFLAGVATLERLGFRVKYSDRIFSSHRYLAGCDHERAEELERTFADPEVQAVIPLRGGYGCARLIPLLHEKELRHHPKIFMGFSDLTTLHLFFRRRFGWVTFHGPMTASKALADLAGEQEKHLLSLWTDPRYRPQFAFPELATFTPGVCEGPLAGGCLSLVVASLGTSYEIKTEGKVLFFEDLGEPPYRIDRMLTQLKLAGKLDSPAGILLGNFADCDEGVSGYTTADVLREFFEPMGIPVLAHFPAGHGVENWGLPLGIRVRLNADNRTLEFLEPAVS